MHQKISDSLLDNCLFFSVNSLARVMTTLGEEELGRIGMTPSAAYLLLVVIEEPGILQKDLAERLHLAPSTVSRMIDAMERKQLVIKEGQGRSTHISPTSQGRNQQTAIHEAWRAVYNRYCDVLGKEEAELLTRLTREAFVKFER